jgi:deoxyribonuclease IV
MFHLNASKQEFNSPVDLDEHIDKRHIAIEAVRLLLNDRRFWGLPMCLETPKGPDLKKIKKT